MDTETRYTLVARLEADTALAALLGHDPNVATARPAILYTQKGQAPPAYDCLTYRISDATPNRRFRPALPGQGTTPICDFRVDFEAWTYQPSAARIEAIGARLTALLDNQAWPVLGSEGQTVARVFKGVCLTYQPGLYDKTLKASFGLFSYLLRVRATP